MVMAKFVIFFLYLLKLSNCANILAIYFHAGKSHHILGEVLLKQLAKRGHNVTMASPFPLSEPFPNYTDIHLTGILEDQLSRESIFMKMNKGHALTGLQDNLDLTRAQTELTLNHTEMAKLLQTGTKFDVIIIDWFLNPAILVFGKLFNAPVILLASHGTTIMGTNIIGNPLPPSYIPHFILPYLNNMTFSQRVINGIVNLVSHITGDQNLKYHESLIAKYIENPPSFEEMRDNVALVFSNGHFSYESPRPYLPNMIPIGGFHVQKPKKLPKDLQKFMDEAEDGVVYFSLGSNMKSVLLPKETRIEILRVLGKIKQRVLWKWEGENLEETPKNVLIRKWFPQNDILAHPNLKLFISHGGLLSTIEALHYGIPVLGIPIFGDQKANIPYAVAAGYALQIDLNELNEGTLTKALNEILSNPKYAQVAKEKSELLHDQPLSPMDTAVFWVEYVIRHKGAPHLRNAGVNLKWYQYFMLDVAAFLFSVVFIIILALYCLIKTCVRYACRRNSNNKKQKTN